MVHLNNSTTIFIMCFYSLLTFFVAPFLSDKFLKGVPYPDTIGFVIGFIISIILWLNYGKQYATK